LMLTINITTSSCSCTPPLHDALPICKLAALLEDGVDCLKSDFGERIPTDVVWHDGSDPVRMHNYYAHLYNKVVFDVLEERRGERSEEHTSELQSRFDLVCRLLLEKIK